MGKQLYIEKNFRSNALHLIETMNEIVDEYVEQGYRLTVRQLYYQLVARGMIENTERSYQNICSTVNDAKLAGLMDWEAIEDRTRAFVRRTRWESGASIMEAAAKGFHMDMWANQEWRVFCVVEKEALAGVLEGVCNGLDIPLLAARGYPSGTVLREFALSDLLPAMGFDSDFQILPGWKQGKGDKALRQKFCILHLGDHDPSGIDMSRDLSERLALFCGHTPGKRLGSIFFDRIALNMNQVQEQKPPENPAKFTDSRYSSYREKFGDKSWELDALSPDYLGRLVRRSASKFINTKKWKEREKEVEEIRARLSKTAEGFR